MFKAASWRRKRPGVSGDSGILGNDPFRDISDDDGGDTEDVWEDAEADAEEEDAGEGENAAARGHAHEDGNAAQRRNGRNRENLRSNKRAKNAGSSESSSANKRAGKSPGAKKNNTTSSGGGSRNSGLAPSSAAGFVPDHLIARKVQPRMNKEEALRIKKSLDSGDGVVTMLKSLLGRNDEVTVSHIIECGLGASVKALRCKGGEEASLARDLTSIWKAKVAGAMHDAAANAGGSASENGSRSSAAVGRPGGTISASRRPADAAVEGCDMNRRDKAVGALDKVP